ncbi:hypothetical protein CKM354_000863000 [Cercospora kikuchii]|uniref:Ricin B lectin domain-containing protein n=1 Tax=Cercospora kikuchii TaxID=84275 RepID=A0A9P3FJV1_9PEZI|nr:uncharacterized protein CKM354_000863000 [Cercospora kikuchii]GIZ45465.1 hypothetical protein CKM354_000863000 [Cercospora kikuchii]
MSDWIGPNSYYIVSREKDTVFIDLSGGSATSDNKVQIWDGPGRTNPNSIWHIVHLGIGSTGRYEYHFLNRKSGTYLTSPTSDVISKTDVQLTVTANLTSPWTNRTRWSIVPCRNNTGAYWIVPVLNTKLALNVKGGGSTNGTELILYAIESDPGAKNAQWFLRLSDDAILNCKDLPKAPLDK